MDGATPSSAAAASTAALATTSATVAHEEQQVCRVGEAGTQRGVEGLVAQRQPSRRCRNGSEGKAAGRIGCGHKTGVGDVLDHHHALRDDSIHSARLCGAHQQHHVMSRVSASSAACRCAGCRALNNKLAMLLGW